MVTAMSLYRNAHGERFWRLSPTAGRTGSYRVEAATGADLDRWLAANGFRHAAAGDMEPMP